MKLAHKAVVLTYKPLAMIICGDRDWTDKARIREVVIDYEPDVVIEGQARGADKLSGLVVEEINEQFVREGEAIEHIPMPAQWDKHGKAAGPIRNGEMLAELVRWRDECDYEIVVVAFHGDIENSKGTKDMVARARKAGVEVEIITE